MTFLSSLHILSMAFGLVLAVHVTGKDFRSWTGRWCSILIVCFSIWNGGMAFKHHPLSTAELQPILSSVNAIGWIFAPGAGLCFVLAFTGREWIFRTKWFWAIFVGLPGVLLYQQFTGNIVVRHELKPFGWYGVFGDTLWAYLFLLYEIMCIVSLLGISWQYARRPHSGPRKTQARIVFFSLLLSAIPITINTALSIVFGATSVPELESIFMLIFCCGIVYAMSRYRFLDLTPSLAAESIVANMPSGMMLLNKDGVLAIANEQAMDMLGMRQGEMAGRHISEFLHEDQMVEGLRNDIVHGSNFKNREINLRTRGGDSLPVSMSRSVMKDDDGDATGIVCLATDLTYAKEKERLLRESEEKYRDLVENINEVVYSLDEKGRLTYINPRIRTLMGYHPEELLGRDFNRLVHPADLEEVAKRFRDVLAGYAWSHEFRVLDKTGEVRWVYSSNRPARKDDVIIGVQGTLMDVTGRRKSEEEKLRLETDLRRSQKMEAVGTLAGGIAHNFNNILYPIMGYAEMALEDLPEDSPVREELEGILTATHRAKDLVKQILAFSHVTKESFHPQDPRPIMDDVITFIKGVLPSTIRIETRLDDNAGFVIGDRAQLHQMLLNLCTNAYQAMASKGGVLELRLERFQPSSQEVIPGLPPGSGPYMRFSVIDTGEGMPQEVMDRIFDPYFTTKPVGEGTGMGLAVTHAMVEKHGGVIQVFSQPGKGARFDILLPAAPASRQEVKIPESHEKVLGNGERILLVDDEAAVRRVTKRALERLGYVVVEAPDGLTAWEAFQQAPDSVDLILTDLTMPGLTGEVLAQRIRKERQDMPIILISGYSESDGGGDEDADSSSSWVRMMKPLEQNQLARIVRQSLDRARSA